ncbi:tail-specific protease precursor [Haemophilus influenzae 22.4-21]|uniref:Tail-specific protease n=3 Tax=Haemophilus influenzae TaxID=727 RepID=A4NXR0_HAEIF|nr:tail-specific protease precursor [Haemophilus influenzae 22.4-21]
MEVGNIDYIDNAVNILNEKHLARIAKDPEFVALNEELKVRNERRDRKFLSLNYKMRKAENDKDDARRLKDLNERFKREGKKALKDIDDLPKDYEAPDFFLKEAEKMAADFVIFNSDQKINQANGLSEAKTESKK